MLRHVVGTNKCNLDVNNVQDHLKAELDVFITNVFFRILESPNAFFDHKVWAGHAEMICC